MAEWHLAAVDKRHYGSDNRRMNEREYLRLKKQAKDEYEGKLRAIEAVWSMARPSASKRRSAAGAQPGRRALKTAVLDAIRGMPVGEQFSTGDVVAALKESDEDAGQASAASIASALARMVESGDIELVQKGAGRRPGVYRKHKEITIPNTS